MEFKGGSLRLPPFSFVDAGRCAKVQYGDACQEASAEASDETGEAHG